jgi:hypothetical protein
LEKMTVKDAWQWHCYLSLSPLLWEPLRAGATRQRLPFLRLFRPRQAHHSNIIHMRLPGARLIGLSSACVTIALAPSQHVNAATSPRGSCPFGSRIPSEALVRQSSLEPSLRTQHLLAQPSSQYAAVLELSAWVSSDSNARLMMNVSLICDQQSDETEGESLFKHDFDEESKS